jgi:hypothetical protein
MIKKKWTHTFKQSKEQKKKQEPSIPIKGKGVAFSGGVFRWRFTVAFSEGSTQWRNPNILERSRGGALATILRSDCATLIFWSRAVEEL